jgi:hypothetical protein
MLVEYDSETDIAAAIDKRWNPICSPFIAAKIDEKSPFQEGHFLPLGPGNPKEGRQSRS